jgi:choline dehydrogenase
MLMSTFAAQNRFVSTQPGFAVAADSSGYDYIVVGAGTAGCVLAARLSEQEDVRVLLLEAGTKEPLPAMSAPGQWLTLLRSSASWGNGENTVVQVGTGTSIPISRGRALGGSSSINGFNFIRGHRSSYDAWAAYGVDGWGFADLLPYFRRSETVERRDPSLRGSHGPMKVSTPVEPHPVVTACVNAAVEVGYPRATDIGAGTEIGFGWFDNTILNGSRLSAADAYLRPVADRPNLKLVTDALVQRVQIKDGRCTGVIYVHGGQPRFAGCGDGGEVVLTAGAIGTAQLLQLSGIGPKEHLRQVGVEVVADLPGVGANLHDHPFCGVIYSARQPVPSLVTNPPGEAVGLVSSDPGLAGPDLQILFGSVPIHAQTLAGPESGYTIAFSAISPHSRGSVRLASTDPAAPPLIDPNYLGDPRDIDTMIKGLSIARTIGAASALDEWRDEEALPGPDVVDGPTMREYLRKGLLCYYHFVGTARLGAPNDPMAVVEADLRVRGIEQLRVADASIMPSVVSANTNATVYGIAERAAELIISGAPS